MKNWSLIAKKLAVAFVACFLTLIGLSAFVFPPSVRPNPATSPTAKKTHKWSPTQTSTATPTATRTATPVPGALCVTVFQDTNLNGVWETTPPAPPPPPTPTVAFTPEPLLAPQNVAVLDSSGTTVGSWDGSGGQPHCFNGLWPGAYTAIETNPPGYGSTTADSVIAPIQSSISMSVLFGDVLCLPRAPVMGQPILDNGSWWLHWENVGALSYKVFGSFTSQTAGTPPEAWHLVAQVATVNYLVNPVTDGTFFYVVAKNNCGDSSPSNVVALP